MKQISTLFTLASLSVFSLFSQKTSAQTTYVDNGTSTNYLLTPGDSLCIKSGTYTGKITSWNSGAKISVEAGATFKPVSVSNYVFKLIIRGTAILPSFSTLSGFSLENYGNTTINNATAQMAQSAQTFNNYYGATITFTGNFAMNINGGHFINQGDVVINGNFNINSTATFTNRRSIVVKGDINVNGGTITNLGRFYTAGKLTFASSSVFQNNCRAIADNGIEISNRSATVYNNGLLWSTVAKNNSILTNSGTLVLTANSYVKSANLTNWGTIRGAGYLYFTANTTGGGNIGTAGNTSDTLRVYDLTRTNPDKIFDTHNSNVYPNVVYNVFAAPDTVNAFPTCAPENATLPLAVKWNYFLVNLSNNVPVLEWSAQLDNSTNFEVQRSYDGTNFSTIAVVLSSEEAQKYQYADQQVNTQVKIVYYRIRAVEPSGYVKFSDVRSVRFANTTNTTVQVTPNPFTSQFSIGYTAAARENVQIRLISMSGQVMVTRSATMNAGFNSLTITEASSLTKGIYLVQIMSENRVVASEKLLKQ